MRLSQFIILLVLCIHPNIIIAQLKVEKNNIAGALVEKITGSGVETSNAILTCSEQAVGFFDGQNSNLNIPSGVILNTGNLDLVVGPNDIGHAGSLEGTPGFAELNRISNTQTFDGCKLEFDVMSSSNYFKFNYSFGSEEYPEYVGSNFNDAFAFLVSGPGIRGEQNIAILPTSHTPVAINNINHLLNSSYYVDNLNGTSIQFDGFTTVMTAYIEVIPCEIYHMKLLIADAGDEFYDSGIFIEEASLTGGGYPREDQIICTNNTTISGTSPNGFWWNNQNVYIEDINNQNTEITVPYLDSIYSLIWIDTNYKCKIIDTIYIIARNDHKDCWSLYLPNSFSPNNVGLNESFFPDYQGILNENYHLKVFNRWGELIFESFDLNIGWNGKSMNDHACPQDTYGYTIQFKSYDGTIHTRKGRISIIL